MFSKLTAPLAFVAACLVTPAHADIVANGGFESGDFTGWTQSGDTAFNGVASGIGLAGSNGAFFGPDPLGSIMQALATTTGQRYEVSFWLALDDSAQPNDFSWSWDGVTIGSLSNSAGFDFTKFTAAVWADASSASLQFNFGNPQSFWRLDDVSVTAIPEPSTALLALGALVAAGSVRRSQRRV
jgi:MYXO-CTERM domain-containing protein